MLRLTVKGNRNPFSAWEVRQPKHSLLAYNSGNKSASTVLFAIVGVIPRITLWTLFKTLVKTAISKCLD
jgi:hypothetical protein